MTCRLTERNSVQVGPAPVQLVAAEGGRYVAALSGGKRTIWLGTVPIVDLQRGEVVARTSLPGDARPVMLALGGRLLVPPPPPAAAPDERAANWIWAASPGREYVYVTLADEPTLVYFDATHARVVGELELGQQPEPAGNAGGLVIGHGGGAHSG